MRSGRSGAGQRACRHVTLPAGLVALSLCLPVSQTFAQPEAISFDISSQPLASALIAYARVTNIEIVLDDSVVKGRQSVGIMGALHPTIALRRMIANTDLDIRYVDRGTVTLVPDRSFARNFDANDDPYASFTVALQAAVARAVCSHRGFSDNPVRVATQLWIGPAGEVVNALLLDSTGDRDRDIAITRRLDTMQIGRMPPVDLPQPATIIFAPDSTRACPKLVEQMR